MKRKLTERPYCSGTMSSAERTSFIKAALRGKSRFWKPAQDALKESKRGYNQYECAICKQIGPSKLPPLPWSKKRRVNNVIDHIEEIVSVDTGFTTWDSFIANLFCEQDGFQILCYECNKKKTSENNLIRRSNKKNND